MSFSAQFLVLSLAVLVFGMVTIGLWVQSAVEQAVMSRTAGVTALYVDSFVGPAMQGSATTTGIEDDGRQRLDELITHTPLGTEIVSFKIWSPSGEILYSPNEELIGQSFDVEEDLSDAFEGEVVSKITSLREPENEFERQRWERLIETYAPIRDEGTGTVVAVSEFYQLPDDLEAEIRTARLWGWIVVAAATATMYALLVGMTRAASKTIRRQRRELEANVEELGATLEQNRDLQAKVNKAAVRTTSLNERFLRRLSADIHDGPAQDVALALLRMEHIAEAMDGNGSGTPDEVETLRTALGSALGDLRAITHGLRSPSVEGMTPCEAARRSVADFERISGEMVTVECTEIDEAAPLSVNITIYRVIQESLANSFRHAGPASRTVRVMAEDRWVDVVVADDGRGFDLGSLAAVGTLGLAGMRERVELLGGAFRVTSVENHGTSVHARVPLRLAAADE
jgi:signal transduction histidine kinase